MEEDKLVKEKQTEKNKNITNSTECQSTSKAEMVALHSQVENELSKALLVLNPESISPRQALDIIYDLRAKAQSKSY